MENVNHLDYILVYLFSKKEVGVMRAQDIFLLFVLRSLRELSC